MSNSFATPWTVAHQAPLYMRFPRQEYWSGLPFSSPEDIVNVSECLLEFWAISANQLNLRRDQGNLQSTAGALGAWVTTWISASNWRWEAVIWDWTPNLFPSPNRWCQNQISYLVVLKIHTHISYNLFSSPVIFPGLLSYEQLRVPPCSLYFHIFHWMEWII